MTEPNIPAHLEPFVRILGVDGAIAFLLEFGGGELYLAADPKGRSAVEQVIGTEKTLALTRAYLPREVPVGKRWIAAVWHSRGLSKMEIARKLHVTVRSVRFWLNDVGAAPERDAPSPQPRLL